MSRFALTYADRVGAGRSAQERYKERYRAWRSRIRIVGLVAAIPILLIALVLSWIWPTYRLLYLCAALGSIVTFVAALSLATPEHVERWRVGAEAEKRTAKALRRLTRRGWVVMHDLPDDYGNRDHVAIAPSGKIFLLDTKAPGGRITIEHGVLRVRWLEDPDDGYDKDLTPRMKGAAFGLANDLAAALPHRPWVTPVVVIWGRWDGEPHVHDDVAWVPGRLLAQRLEANAGPANPERHTRMVDALRARAR